MMTPLSKRGETRSWPLQLQYHNARGYQHRRPRKYRSFSFPHRKPCPSHLYSKNEICLCACSLKTSFFPSRSPLASVSPKRELKRVERDAATATGALHLLTVRLCTHFTSYFGPTHFLHNHTPDIREWIICPDRQ